MASENLRTSELDRELDADLQSDDSMELFGDDTDEDPTYYPDCEQPSTSKGLFMPSRSTLSDSSSDISDLENEQGRAVPNPPKRPRLASPTRHNRQVLTDSSDDDDFVDLPGSGDENNPPTRDESWEKVEENDGVNFVHSFTFLETPGPRHCNLDPMTAKPTNYFSLFFTSTLLEMFVRETNRYGSQVLAARGNTLSPFSRLRSWNPVSLIEVKAFIAVLLNMGLIKKPTIKSYWSKTGSQSTTWFGKMFTRVRFESVLSFFHMVDNSKLPKSNEPGYDGAQKFQPLQDHCNRLFQYYYTAHQQLSIDESLIGTKNQTSLMQYLPNKHHHRWGIKLWVLCDATSKYCMSFFCYKGAKSQEDKDEIKKRGLAYTVVCKLLSVCNYVNKGYHIFTDNFFTSLPLVKMLYSKQTFMTGTIRKNRKGLPNEVKGNLGPGEKVYCKQGNTVVLAYRQKQSQKKPVLLISSHTEVKEIETTKRRRGREMTESKPAVIQDYNQHMGGIDHFDMMLYSYLDERRTIKYWKKVTFNIFARMVLNGYILYKENSVNNNVRPMSRYQFIVSVIDSISEEWLTHKQLEFPVGGDGDNLGQRGLERLPESKVKTCWVCTIKGKDYNKSRKKSRLVCSWCKEGCHSVCFAKHVCK